MTDAQAHLEPLRTSPAVERAVGMLLGADEARARAAVDALAVSGRLGDGIALHALLLAARKGTDAPGAIALLAEGEEPPATWSAYEGRVAEEEAGDEVLLPRRPEPGGTTVVAEGTDAPVMVLVALREGVGSVVVDPEAACSRDGLAPARARCDHGFVARLAQCVGAAVTGPRTSGPSPATGVVPDREGGPIDGTVERADGYIDALAKA